MELPTTPTPRPQSISDDVCLGVVTNFCLQEAFQTINPSPVIEISIIKNRYLPLLKGHFVPLHFYARSTLVPVFMKWKKKNPKRIFAFNRGKVKIGNSIHCFVSQEILQDIAKLLPQKPLSISAPRVHSFALCP